MEINLGKNATNINSENVSGHNFTVVEKAVWILEVLEREVKTTSGIRLRVLEDQIKDAKDAIKEMKESGRR